MYRDRVPKYCEDCELTGYAEGQRRGGRLELPRASRGILSPARLRERPSHLQLAQPYCLVRPLACSGAGANALTAPLPTAAHEQAIVRQKLRISDSLSLNSGAGTPCPLGTVGRKRDHVQLISEDILKELLSVDGRYIEWEWDPRTLANDYITMREPDGLQVVIRNTGGRSHPHKVPLRALEELIQEQLISEDPSRKVAGFRLYRLNAEGRKRGSHEC